MNHRSPWICWGFIAAGLGLGCQVPSYQLPGGFSSTYYRFLHGEVSDFPPPVEMPVEAAWPSNASPAAGSAPSKTCPPTPGVFYPQTFEYNPPTRSEFQQTVLLPEKQPEGPGRY